MGQVNLNRRLILETLNRVGDGAGGFADIWQPLGVVWGNVGGRTAAQKALAAGDLSKVSYRIIVRGAPQGSSLRPALGQRFRDKDRVFPIDAVFEQDDAGLYLECRAHEEILA